MTRFAKGSRVQRRKNVYDEKSEMLHGEIIRCYQKSAEINDIIIDYDELYEVEWDDGKTQKGFLPHGLDHEQSKE